MVRVLGIDPGSRLAGFGIVDSNGNNSKFVVCGVIKPPTKDLAAKLEYIHRQVSDLVDSYQPEQVAIEKVFVHKNPDSALKLGQARGVMIAACALKDTVVFEYTANQVKQAIVGRGHATKQQVQHMVKILLCLSDTPTKDAADALAIALCHAHTYLGGVNYQVRDTINRGSN